MKPKVLVFIDWFLPAFKAGGPIQSVANLIDHLGSEISISIVTSDRDLGDAIPLPGIELNKWIAKENYRIIYLESSLQTNKYYTDIFLDQEYDYVYLNSLFSVKFTLLPLWVARNFGSKIILAPRGMLGLGALNIKKTKKKVFLFALGVSGYSKKIIWHATAQPEAIEIKKYFGEGVEIRLAPNFSSKNSVLPKIKEKKQNQLNLFFLSRIAEKKNLKLAIQLLKELKDEIRIEFTIIGPIGEESYWIECQQLIAQLPPSKTVVFIGPIPNASISDCLARQHFLLLPTFHENFGHVFIESWTNSCPVIISDQTPWRNLEEKGIGWDISLADTSKFIEAIEKAASMDQADYSRMSEAAFDFAKSFIENPAVLEANRKLFNLS
jgi:glycosyltransferase involved in cell wall biosynthesis